MLYDKLSKLQLFQEISPKAIDCINQLPYIDKRYDTDEKVADFGDKIDYIYVILKGALKTNEYTVAGKEIVSSYYLAYDAFPFYLVYSGVEKIPYNVFCHKKAEVLLLPKQQLMA
ncbi:Crp/Fnr family transcriptional regulator [Facklamia sp. DSM 111019]|uniref:Crp/Fnr family transcriptional regulator n=1 Tax=Facklamia lactis TaxID=2749967 RepID=UPI0018CEFD26|nr:Crp/Fnr family transcriptional regulator [Facklamia lactis]MBG9981180.1 Crp/Fnr family transcriptional regulator [Facklamia lactis]